MHKCIYFTLSWLWLIHFTLHIVLYGKWKQDWMVSAFLEQVLLLFDLIKWIVPTQLIITLDEDLQQFSPNLFYFWSSRT